MPHRFDATLKDIVTERRGNFAVPFGLPTNEPVTAINVDLSTVSAGRAVAAQIGKYRAANRLQTLQAAP